MVSSLQLFGQESWDSWDSDLTWEHGWCLLLLWLDKRSSCLLYKRSEPSLPDSHIWDGWQCKVLQHSLTLLPPALKMLPENDFPNSCYLHFLLLLLILFAFSQNIWPYSDFCSLSQDIIYPGFKCATSPLVSQNPQDSPLSFFFLLSSSLLFVSSLPALHLQSRFSFQLPESCPHLTHPHSFPGTILDPSFQVRGHLVSNGHRACHEKGCINFPPTLKTSELAWFFLLIFSPRVSSVQVLYHHSYQSLKSPSPQCYGERTHSAYIGFPNHH